jgi:alcohol dehydrogenase (NADP+)
MQKVKSYAAESATSPLVPFEIERREVLENDVEFDILYC